MCTSSGRLGLTWLGKDSIMLLKTLLYHARSKLVWTISVAKPHHHHHQPPPHTPHTHTKATGKQMPLSLDMFFFFLSRTQRVEGEIKTRSKAGFFSFRQIQFLNIHMKEPVEVGLRNFFLFFLWPSSLSLTLSLAPSLSLTLPHSLSLCLTVYISSHVIISCSNNTLPSNANAPTHFLLLRWHLIPNHDVWGRVRHSPLKARGIGHFGYAHQEPKPVCQEEGSHREWAVGPKSIHSPAT